MHKAKLRRAGWRVKHARGKWLAAEHAKDREASRAPASDPFAIARDPEKWARHVRRAVVWNRARVNAAAAARELPGWLAYDAMIFACGVGAMI